MLPNAARRPQLPTSTHFARSGSPLADALVAIRPEMLAHARQLTHSATRAEDLVQDTVERALRFEDHFEPGTNLRGWTRQIMNNLFCSRCRQLRRERHALEVLTADPCAWTIPELDSVTSQTLARGTQQALQALPAPFQSTVVLIDLMNYSYRAAADRLGVPLGTVMSRLHRGRRLLAGALRPEQPQRQAA